MGEGGDRVTDFEQLYDTYFNDVYLYILRLSGNEHIAEEITSDTFFKAMKSINSFRGDCDVRVWLCQIAKNRYYSHLKKSKRVEHVEEDDITTETDIQDDLGADSLDLFEVAMAFEEEFDVEIPTEELEKFTTVGSIAEYMRKNSAE